ncbi:hypothetical protein LTR81_016128 [Elasticomyces elasticus]
MPPKRKSSSSEEASEDDFVENAPAPKKARTQRLQPGEHTLASLLALPHEALAAYALSLQQKGLLNGSAAETWSEEKIAERADKTRDVCRAEIKKQMKWQPSCKQGSTKWSYNGLVPHEDVFYKLFRFEKPKKPWKVKKIDRGEFDDIMDGISASVRCNTLRITGADVKVHWDQEEKTFKLVGTYGL